MDFVNLITSDKMGIEKIINSQNFTSTKEYPHKDIFRIGRKGVKVIANKELDKDGNFKRYSLAKITIKPHFYFNQDLHNGNQFTASESISVLNEIANKLNINDFQILKPTSLDYGINVIPEEWDTKDIVTQTLFYKKKPFEYPYKHLTFYKTTFPLGAFPTIGAKIYHKGIQYPDFINANTLRFENVFKTFRKLETQFKIKSFADMMNEDFVNKLNTYLLKSWEHVLILDEISDDLQIHNPNYYNDQRHFRNGLLNAKYEYYKTHGKLHSEIRKLFEWNLKGKPEKMQIQTLIDSWNLHKTDQKDIVGICTEIRKCKVTQLDISSQRQDSEFLCITGIRELKKNNPKIFLSLKKNLTSKQLQKNEDEQIIEIAHRIRNKYFNQFHNSQRSAQRNIPLNQGRFDFEKI